MSLQRIGKRKQQWLTRTCNGHILSFELRPISIMHWVREHGAQFDAVLAGSELPYTRSNKIFVLLFDGGMLYDALFPCKSIPGMPCNTCVQEAEGKANATDPTSLVLQGLIQACPHLYYLPPHHCSYLGPTSVISNLVTRGKHPKCTVSPFQVWAVNSESIH